MDPVILTKNDAMAIAQALWHARQSGGRAATIPRQKEIAQLWEHLATTMTNAEILTIHKVPRNE